MVKAVIAEETQLKLAEDRLSQSGLPSQVGLVIGKLSSALDRGFVFYLIPTPPNDAGEPACSLIQSAGSDKKKGSKGKSQSDSSSLFIDKDWVAEHARQVSRMLLGGVKVIGTYVWVNEGSFKNSTVTLCQSIKGVAEAAPLLNSDWDERLLIHISYSPRRWTCRNCSLSSSITSSSLRPCDFKMGRVLSSLQTFKCTYNFDLRLPIWHESNIRKLSDILRHGISNHAKELSGAKALVDGKLMIEAEQSALDGPHEVEFLLPFMQNSSVEACSMKEVIGALIFTGSVSSYGYLNTKEPISQALADIKEDIIMSLQSRLDIICDEADEESDSIAGAEGEASHEISSAKPIHQLDLQLLRKGCSLPFPRRVFVPWLAGTYICDYLQPSDTIEVVKDHCAELMSMDAAESTSTILEPEMDAPILMAKSFWDMVFPFSPQSKNILSSGKSTVAENQKSGDGKSNKSADFNIFAAVLVLSVAVIIGVVLFVQAS